MVKRTVNPGQGEPEQKAFDLPSEKEHLFQVTDLFTSDDDTGRKLGLDENTVSVKLEIVGGDEEGRTLLQRLSLDSLSKGFFATRLFLKAIGEEYKGDKIDIDTDNWIGHQAYAIVIHNGKYANIKEYNFDKKIEQVVKRKFQLDTPINPEDIAWQD